MDVDVIFRRGYAYTLATLVVLAAFYSLVFSLGSMVQKNFKDLGNTGLIGVMLSRRSCSSRCETGFRSGSIVTFIATVMTTAVR